MIDCSCYLQGGWWHSCLDVTYDNIPGEFKKNYYTTKNLKCFPSEKVFRRNPVVNFLYFVSGWCGSIVASNRNSRCNILFTLKVTSVLTVEVKAQIMYYVTLLGKPLPDQIGDLFNNSEEGSSIYNTFELSRFQNVVSHLINLIIFHLAIMLKEKKTLVMLLTDLAHSANTSSIYFNNQSF